MEEAEKEPTEKKRKVWLQKMAEKGKVWAKKLRLANIRSSMQEEDVVIPEQPQLRVKRKMWAEKMKEKRLLGVKKRKVKLRLESLKAEKRKVRMKRRKEILEKSSELRNVKRMAENSKLLLEELMLGNPVLMENPMLMAETSNLAEVARLMNKLQVNIAKDDHRLRRLDIGRLLNLFVEGHFTPLIQMLSFLDADPHKQEHDDQQFILDPQKQQQDDDQQFILDPQKQQQDDDQQFILDHEKDDEYDRHQLILQNRPDSPFDDEDAFHEDDDTPFDEEAFLLSRQNRLHPPLPTPEFPQSQPQPPPQPPPPALIDCGESGDTQLPTELNENSFLRPCIHFFDSKANPSFFQGEDLEAEKRKVRMKRRKEILEKSSELRNVKRMAENSKLLLEELMLGNPVLMENPMLMAETSNLAEVARLMNTLQDNVAKDDHCLRRLDMGRLLNLFVEGHFTPLIQMLSFLDADPNKQEDDEHLDPQKQQQQQQFILDHEKDDDYDRHQLIVRQQILALYAAEADDLDYDEDYAVFKAPFLYHPHDCFYPIPQPQPPALIDCGDSGDTQLPAWLNDKCFLRPVFYYLDYKTDPSFYFQVERCPYEDGLAHQLFECQPSWTRHSNVSDTTMNSVVIDELVFTILHCHDIEHSLASLYKGSVKANHFDFFHSAIRAFATLVILLYSKDYLFDLAHYRISRIQMSKMLPKYADMEKQGCDRYEVCESIVRDKIDREHCFVTEGDFSDLLTRYGDGLTRYDLFDVPNQDYRLGERKTPLFQEIKKVVSAMTFPPGLKADDYTRMLIAHTRLDSVKYVERFLVRAVELVDTAAMYKLNPADIPCCSDLHEDIDLTLKGVLLGFIHHTHKEIEEQLLDVPSPLDLLKPRSLFISPRVYEIVEVAELRRRALGGRFISRNHLMWAFFELGYGLPHEVMSKFRTAYEEEDHPPLDVYMTSIKFAELFEEKTMKLEHFVFSVLYLEDFGDKGKQHCNVLGMKDQFAEFMKEVDADYKKRPKVMPVSQIESFLKSYGIDIMDISIEELHKEIKSGKLDDFVRETSSIL